MKRWIRGARSSSDYSTSQKGLRGDNRHGGFDSSDFDEYQINQIRKGLKQGLDVSVYADPRYSKWQMDQIRRGLEEGLDVSTYANPKYDSEKMEKIRKGLESVYFDF